MPLYCCEVCGWATTAFRVDAVREHHSECPSCAGTMRIAFHLEEPPIPHAAVPAETEPEQIRAIKLSLRRRAERRGRPSRIDSVAGAQRRSLSR